MAPSVPEKVAPSATVDTEVLELRGVAAAIDRSQAMVEFDLTGRILTANDNFLQVVGYSLPEIVGKHHRVFCDPTYILSPEYAAFWKELALGRFQSGEFRRLTKSGDEVWLQATYNPILGADGNPWKIVKLATDITQDKATGAESAGKVAAIDRAQAVIEFDLTGQIITANQNFLDAMGYSLREVQGAHHRVFVDKDEARSEEYAQFWRDLGEGRFFSGEFRRVTKEGREVWLQATYNPILDAAGRPVKVVKFASDITEQKRRNTEFQARIAAVDRGLAVIEFDLEGIVLTANENFLRVMGYSLREIVGQHHSFFCSDTYVRSPDYRDFWLRLGKGEVIAGRFHRKGKFGRDVHIQSAYNPILDPNGTPTKVVKYAYDVTDDVEREQRVATGTRAMATSVDSLSTSSRSIASSSDVATELAQQTQADAERGVEALRASLEAIALIQRSSAAISDIVRVMAEIANQTNLLAFNASIEAARAGEHGVGFSIVAGEVRKLAERSSEAAQQIGTLIEESTERVNEGAEVSKNAEGAFQRIVSSVARTNEAIRTIAGDTAVQLEASQAVDRLMRTLGDDQTGV